ncbi:heme-binding protein [Novosphingobium umbonatum]|uniref:Heme-binding protein n=1 Tax=Novosphingobium umbonatum TaxID=1908524 RepID=A0A437MX88_9SPHN|nr:heme-binding protein [Novosphingobium umbonatum]RVU02282.1 heme-binding protein [Novosphingobium umbonatum]
MISRNNLSLAEAQFLAEAACAAARAKGDRFPISVSVVDTSTYLQALARMDGAPLFSAQGSFDKARSSAEGGHPTTFFEKPLNEGRFSMVKLPHTPIEGGLPVIVDGQCVGAVGVAGAPPHLDAEFAQAAIDAFLAKGIAK